MIREEYINFANCLKNNYTIDFDKLPEFCDMAISALSENKGDLISRQAVLDLLQMKYSGKELYKAIYDLPSVENKGEWIPITYRPATAEELEGTEYTEGNIFTCEMPEDGETVYISIYGETLTDTFHKDGFDSYFEDWGIEHVKAWYKKPEPYKAESEGTE